jgi:hypothetical protein
MKLRNIFQGILFSACILLLTSNCKKDDNTKKGCTNFPSSGKEISFNGANAPISIAQLAAQTGGGSEDTYVMQLGVITEDCNKLTTISLNFEVRSGASLAGTFPIKDFFAQRVGEASGDLAEQKISPTSQTSLELVSGTAIITNKGNNLFNLNINAKPVGGNAVTLKGDVQF